MTSFTAFYASPVGSFFRSLVLSHLRSIKPHQSVLGVGPVVPIVDKITCQGRAVLVPEIFWESVARDYPVMSFNEKSALPLKKEAFDHILIIHTLEHTAYPASFLREIWRALRPGGTLTLCLPNRVHPFDDMLELPQSKIYKALECHQVLTESFFHVSSRRTCSFLPPRWVQRMPKVCSVLEKCLSALPVPYGGRVTLIQAQKDISLNTSENAPLTWQRA